MAPKQSEDYLKEILEKMKNEDINKIIWSKYGNWKSSHTTSSFDELWLEANKKIQRGLLGQFNGASFEEHIHDLIINDLPLQRVNCFWGLDKDKEKRKKVNFRLDERLPHKFDLAIFGHNDKPICLIECKSYLNYFELLGLATFCRHPDFQGINIFYLTHLLTVWDLDHKLINFVENQTSDIRRFHFLKIGALLWSGKKGEPFEIDRKLDQTENFLETLVALFA